VPTPTPDITPDAAWLVEWQRRQNLSDEQAADLLALSISAYRNQRSGRSAVRAQTAMLALFTDGLPYEVALKTRVIDPEAEVRIPEILRAGNLTPNEQSLCYLPIFLKLLKLRYQRGETAAAKRKWEKHRKAFAEINKRTTALLKIVTGDWGNDIEFMISGGGADTRKIAAALRLLLDATDRAEDLLPAEAPPNRPRGVRSETAQTSLFSALRQAFIYLGGEDRLGASGGPLYCFVSACAEAINSEILMPKPEAFRIRMLKAAEQRRHQLPEQSGSQFF
jgi:hypothetical protein